jgi:cold shock protein
MYKSNAISLKSVFNKIAALLFSQKTKQSIIKKGTVKFFNESKGYGFITTEDGDDVFVHANGVSGRIRQKDSVKFQVEKGRKGPQAVKVSLA